MKCFPTYLVHKQFYMNAVQMKNPSSLVRVSSLQCPGTGERWGSEISQIPYHKYLGINIVWQFQVYIQNFKLNTTNL